MISPKDKHATSGILENMTIADVQAFGAEVVVIPLGSTEPHGPHLPYGTDTLIVDSVTEEAVRRANTNGARILRLPTLPIGNNVNFKAFPFACRIRVETLMAVLMDLVSFLREEGIRKIVIVNSHGGNDDAIKAGLRQIHDRYQREVFVCACGPGNFAGDEYKKHFKDSSPHAGEYETSMIQRIAPDLVVEPALQPVAMKQPAVSALASRAVEWVRPWHEFMPTSCGGRPDLASAEKGEHFLEASAAGLARFLEELSKAPWHRSFPYPPEDSSNSN